MRRGKLQILLFLALASYSACGGGGDTQSDDPADNNSSDAVNTDKLIGTPFEGLTTGDDFDWYFFVRCGQYRTETIDTLPIKIFAAFFTASEEAIIQEGIDIANEAMGPTSSGGVFYELTDIWSNDVRVLYKTNEISSEEGTFYAYGITLTVESRFNGNSFADTQMPDWAIEVIPEGINKWVIAHELGHASGIAGHYLINYEADSISALNNGELMDPGHSLSDPLLDQYTYMMQQQASIIQNYLQQNGTQGSCNN